VTDHTATFSRRAVIRGALACAAVSCAAPVLAAPSRLTGAGDIRTIRLFNPRTGDRLNSVYWVEGEYIPEVMAEIDWLMRDWRSDSVKPIARKTVDIIAATHRLLETSEPFTVYSGYRTPQTNRLLRSKSRGVARNSYHIKAMAADLHMEARSVSKIARAAQALGGGGVGRYSRSDFVHMDCGPVRSWGR
jgi:uncharacterized protein YcbK (DUF882 family)